jgi:hypothetical protein
LIMSVIVVIALIMKIMVVVKRYIMSPGDI